MANERPGSFAGGETFHQRSPKGRETGKTGERHLAAGPFREAGKAGYMAKAGIDYFPLNCRLDEKFELIEAEYGLKGFAVIVKLLQRIYGEHGYYCEWNDDIALLFARQVLSCSGANNLIASIVAASVRRGIFDQTLFEQYGILTSKGIQKRYLEITYKRKAVEMKKAYLLLSVAEIKGNVTILGDSVDRNEENDDRNGQSKGKESKEKDIKRVERPVPARPTFSEDSFEMRCVEQLVRAVKEQLPGARVPESLEEKARWAVHVERMKRLDKRTEAEILEALNYAVTDPFWKTNIRSTAKLREKFETLILQARQKRSRAAGGNRDENELEAWRSHHDYYGQYLNRSHSG